MDISFFGDDLDYEQMAALTGSEALARQLAQAMKEADLPCTEENVRGVMEALHWRRHFRRRGRRSEVYAG